MSYFSKFLRSSPQPAPKAPVNHVQEFSKSWAIVKNTLLEPDERQLTRGIGATDVPAHLRSMVDALVSESTRPEQGETGECLEYLLKNDVLGTLVRLSESDRPSGIQAEVLRAVQNMVVLLDEQFLVHSAVHRAVLRLLRTCVGDDIQEQLDGRNKTMGAAGTLIRTPPSAHEEDLVNLLCILCSRIMTYRELLMIFFHDKHWYRSEPLFSVEEEDDEDDDEDEGLPASDPADLQTQNHPCTPSPTLSQATITSAEPSTTSKKTEYEFLLFNYLLRFAHREGQIGEFARAGLLFLIDVAMSSRTSDHRAGDDKSEPPTATTDPVQDAALALAEYILDGDFSDVLGAGLNAVYSLLPTKLGFFQHPHEENGSRSMVIGSSGLEDEDEKEQILANRDRNRALGIEDVESPDFKARLDHFLKLLEFLQDVLRKNVEYEGVDASYLVGAQIVQSVLDAVRRTFLENVLYPSILECSDLDGSAVAVMSYIEVIIRTLRPGPLLNLIIDFLLDEDSDEPRQRQRGKQMLTLGDTPPRVKNSDKAAKQRRRKSSAMALLEMEAPDSRKKSDYFTSTGRFTIRDLLLANLKSKNQATATAALQLLDTMLNHHPESSSERLLMVIPDSQATAFPHPTLLHGPPKFKASFAAQDYDSDDFHYPGGEDQNPPPVSEPLFLQPETTYSTHEREMHLYLALISRVDPSHANDGFSTGYDRYLHDALISIQSQPIYFLANEMTFDAEENKKYKHRLNANDPILSSLLESTRTFFSNTPDFNVALTGVFATLAINPHRSLAGWLTFAHNDDPFKVSEVRREDSDDDGDDRSIDFRIDQKLATDTNYLPAARMDEHSRPVVHTVFQSLLNQLERYRRQVDDFDKYLTERRQGLLFSEKLTDALQIILDDEPAPIKSTFAETPAKPKPKARASATSAIAAFWTPKKPKLKPAPAQPVTPQRPQGRTVSASPFGSHYQQTGSITVEPFIAPVPFTALWTPSKKATWSPMEEDVFGSGWTEKTQSFDHDDEEEQAKPPTVTLSQLLDNVVILEESIKELVAIIHARRSLGIDALRYV